MYGNFDGFPQKMKTDPCSDFTPEALTSEIDGWIWPGKKYVYVCFKLVSVRGPC